LLAYSAGSPKMNASKRRDHLRIYRYLMKVVSGCPLDQDLEKQ
jgi:hypothetical protein